MLNSLPILKPLVRTGMRVAKRADLIVMISYKKIKIPACCRIFLEYVLSGIIIYR